MKESLLDKADRKFGRYGIPNLMTIIAAGMGLVYVLDLFFYGTMQTTFSSFLAFDRNAVLHGQIWRLVTFIFIPPNSSMLFILLSLYFYWLIGNGLENQWGAFRFNVFYLCGMLGAVISGMITGYATNNYLNLSLFLAFAFLYPNYQVMLFFFLPIKVKYLAILDAVGLLISLIRVPWAGKIALLISLGNVLLFSWRYVVQEIQNARRRREWKNNFRN